MGAIIHHGDAVKWARDYSGPLFHALFCDAPYEMEFMGKEWDGSGVSFDPETWRAFARVLYPGAFLFVCAGTINDDLISYAMREAGLRKFHKMMGWVYGSGFPKASRVNHGSPKTETFSGHRYGLQALKPAIETILIFQKPYEGKPIDDITRTGAGVLNIDGGRIPADNKPVREHERVSGFADVGRQHGSRAIGETNEGRWPSNFFLDPQTAKRLDEQSGERPVSGSAKNGRPATGEYPVGMFGVGDKQGPLYNDNGGASRFFFQIEEQIDEADPVHYCGKASTAEREAGLLGRVPCSSFDQDGVIHEGDPLHSREHYITEKGKRRAVKCRRNSHTTVKPISLARYISTLILPPVEYAPRRLFVPFSGVGSEVTGAVLAGWEEVEGVELTEEYIPISRARLEYWQGKKVSQVKPSKSNGSTPKESNQMRFI